MALTDALLLGFADYAAPAQRLATALGIPYAEVELHRFPDEEVLVRLPVGLPRRVIICRSLDRPDPKLIELMFAAEAARAAGVSRLELVAPYLCYMRQDCAFRPGEAISQQIVGHWLARLFDAVITVDAHLHRVHRIEEAVPAQRALCLSAGAPMAEFLRGRLQEAVLIGPDSESRQWVADIARRAGLAYVIAAKVRHSDREVTVTLPHSDLRNRTVVVVDDVASTARTLAAAARAAREAGAAAVHCLVTHGLFVDGAEALLRGDGVTELWSSDSVQHSSNVIQLAPLLAASLES